MEFVLNNKKGAGIFTFILILVALLIVIVFGVNLFNQFTGYATLTPGAYYGPINPNYENYIDCVYLTKNDGWDVTINGKIKYYDIRKGNAASIEDGCEGPDTVTEYHCVDGYLKKRKVGCASNMKCDVGICV